MYNGFTHPSFRGQRLHAVSMMAALRSYAREGLTGLVSYVVAPNFSSLKSCFRMGYVNFGYVAVTKLGGKFICRATPGCARYGFRVEPAPRGWVKSFQEQTARMFPHPG